MGKGETTTKIVLKQKGKENEPFFSLTRYIMDRLRLCYTRPNCMNVRKIPCKILSRKVSSSLFGRSHGIKTRFWSVWLLVLLPASGGRRKITRLSRIADFSKCKGIFFFSGNKEQKLRVVEMPINEMAKRRPRPKKSLKRDDIDFFFFAASKVRTVKIRLNGQNMLEFARKMAQKTQSITERTV